MDHIDIAELSDKYGVDIVDGREEPQLVVRGDYALVGLRHGTVHVERGTLCLDGVHQGSLHMHGGTTALIAGRQQGSITVERGATVRVTGAIEGSTAVVEGGTVVVEARARLAGSLENHGDVVVRGVFGGPYSGRGSFRLEGAGHIKEPIIHDGRHIYQW